MHSRTPVRAALVASVLISAPLLAAEPTTIAPVIVTATRTAQTADETVAPVTVITREEIEQSGAVTLPNLLAGRAGLDISGNGRFGKGIDINMRGLGGNKVLYLINGMRIADPSAIGSAPSIQHIPVSQIERIEIVRGPRSTLYGSQALGGVINIITRKPDDTTFEAVAGGGTYSSARAHASVSGVGERLSYNLAVGGFETKGYDITEEGFEDADGYENRSASGRLHYAVTDDLDLSTYFLADEGTTEFDACSFPAIADCHTEFTQVTVGLESAYRITDRWDTSLRVSRGSQERRNFQDDVFFNGFDSSVTTTSWQNDFFIGGSQLVTVGVDRTHAQVEQPDSFVEDERTRTGVFAQWQVHARTQDLVVGVRGIEDEAFGSHTVGNIDYGIDIADGLRFLASVGTAFKAPSLYQLYASSPFFKPNPDLEAQKSTSIEFGLAGHARWGHWTVRSYRTQAHDLIDYVGCSPFPCNDSQYRNVDEVEINGLEFVAGTQIGRWDTRLSYSWSEPVDEDTGAVLPNRAERSFRLSMDRSFGALSAGGSIVAQSDRTGSQFSDPVAGYGTLNLHAGYQIHRDWRLRATVDNVFDLEYQTTDGYVAAGRVAFVYLEYRPG